MVRDDINVIRTPEFVNTGGDRDCTRVLCIATVRT